MIVAQVGLYTDVQLIPIDSRAVLLCDVIRIFIAIRIGVLDVVSLASATAIELIQFVVIGV